MHRFGSTIFIGLLFAVGMFRHRDFTGDSLFLTSTLFRQRSRAGTSNRLFSLERDEGSVSTPVLAPDTETVPQDPEPAGPTGKQDRSVCWKASVKSSVRVKETTRTSEAYMALPASEYSVLSAQQVERLSDSQFKFALGSLNFFGTKIAPVLYVDVNVFPEEHRSEIAVRRAETVGSAVAEKINGTFSISALNVVSAGVDQKGRKILCSDVSLQIDAVVPESSRLPLGLVQSGGNFVVQSSLSLVGAAFVRILAADFQRWSAGNDSRTALEGASLALEQ